MAQSSLLSRCTSIGKETTSTPHMLTRYKEIVEVLEVLLRLKLC